MQAGVEIRSFSIESEFQSAFPGSYFSFALIGLFFLVCLSGVE